MILGDRKYLGYPKSHVKRDWQLSKYCGGSGGAPCVTPLGVTKVFFYIDISPLVVFNRNLVLHNPEFSGVRIYTNGGASGPCPDSIGTEQQWYLAFGTTSTLTDAQIVAQNNVFSGAPPYSIEIGANKLPQPSDPTWGQKIYIYIYWGNTAYVNYAQALANFVQYLKIVKHDYDMKL